MSATLAAGSVRTGSKATCQKCGRTVVVVPTETGRELVDPEVMQVVQWPLNGKATTTLHARRLHAERCATYRLEAEKAEARRRLRGRR